MDPVTIGVAAVGLGLKIFGGMGASSDAKQISQLSQQNSIYENGVNQQRQQAMELSARRQQMENYRNTQRARAMGIASSVSQGAQLGSGMQGGQAQAADQGAFNDLGITQNLQIGRNIFGLDAKISQNNAQIAGLKGQEATNQGWASLGGSLMSASGTIGNIGKSFDSAASSAGSGIFGMVNSGGMLFQ